MKTRVKKLLLFSAVGVVLLLGTGYFGYKTYRSVRQTRLVKQAREFLDNSEPRKALLSLQRALRYNGNDIEACRLMAQITEAARSPNAILWRDRVVDLKPDSLDDRLALARVGLAFGDFAAATNALNGVSEEGKKTASYNNVAGLVAASSGQPTVAETHFAEAARLEPSNPAPQINLAVVRLQGTNVQKLAAARTALTAISQNPTNSALR
ncbi:MAG TPA: hypothetical protein VN673_00835, partial [Clostridia bacterium]|nr:hypothetical protein [Clostridia bacterium]